MKISLELQPCCGNKSGIGVYTYEIAKRMQASEGVELQGNIFNFLGRNDNSGCLEGIPFPVWENRLFPYGVYRRIWDKAPIRYGRLFPPADISIFFNFIAPPRITGKIAVVVHDMTYLRYPETVDARNMKRLLRGLDDSIARSVRIITVSEFSKSEITALCGVPKEKIEVVYPAASVIGGTCDFNVLSHRLGLEKDYLLFVGSIEPRKNLLRLLLAFDAFKARTGLAHGLVLCGGNGWNNEEIHAQLARMRYRDDIILTGYLSDAERNTLYCHASALVFPSVYEGFGVPPLEAMHWDTPVICSRAASLPEVAGEAARYVDPFSVESIAEGLEQVLTDREYAWELVARGRAQREKFSWDRSAGQLLEILKNTAR